MLEGWKRRAARLKREAIALYLAARDPRTPWYARLVAGAVVAYLFSPLDLIQDVIPVLGLVDDLVIVPVGIALAIKLIPSPVLADARQRAAERLADGKPVNRKAAAVIVALWLVAAALIVYLLTLL